MKSESLRTLLLTWAALLLLLALTFASAYVHLGTWNAVVNIVIAIAKAALVMTLFMHLKDASGLTRAFGVAAFFFVILLIGLALSDVLSR